jgi:quercetin dioxygenase-like cupin family protein
MTLDLRAGTPWPATLAPLRTAPDPAADPLVLLLADGEAMASPVPAPPSPRERLLRRVQRSARAAAAMHTARQRTAAWQPAAPGVERRSLHAARPAAAHPPRPGEPRRSELLRLAPGATLPLAAEPGARSWFVLAGGAGLQAAPAAQGAPDAFVFELGAHDHLHGPAGVATLRAGDGGALLLRREADGDVGRGAPGWQLQRSAESAWTEFAPGVRRRVMWAHGGEAAMLYATAPGAAVPHHGHRHDEECLMLAGELFLDEVLLGALDYQLAPAGTEHGSVFTDTGVLLYAHGDLELDLIAG